MRTRSGRELGSFRDDRTAAWELHVELATRVSAVPLPDGEGLLREALASLDVLASGSREMLHEHGAHVIDGEPCPVVRLVEQAAGTVEEFLARWRPRLEVLAAGAPLGLDPVKLELDWLGAAGLRADLASVRTRLRAVAERLAEHAGAVSLLAVVPPELGSEVRPG